MHVEKEKKKVRISSYIAPEVTRTFVLCDSEGNELDREKGIILTGNVSPSVAAPAMFRRFLHKNGIRIKPNVYVAFCVKERGSDKEIIKKYCAGYIKSTVTRKLISFVDGNKIEMNRDYAFKLDIRFLGNINRDISITCGIENLLEAKDGKYNK